MVTLDVLFTGFFTALRFRMTSIFSRAHHDAPLRPYFVGTFVGAIHESPGNGKQKDRPCPLFLLYKTRAF